MTRGFYSATAAMMSDVERFETVANNLANINTHGFKRHQTLHHDFQQGFLERIQTARPRMQVNTQGLLERELISDNPRAIGALGTGTFITGNWTHFEQGPLEETQNKFDLALKDAGFFCVELPDGQVHYTRNGHFKLNADHELVTAEGYHLLGESGRISVEPTARFSVDAQGNVYADGEVLDQLKLVNFAQPQNLLNEGNNRYLRQTNMQELDASPEIAQGFLEQSNVNVAGEMVTMISAFRSYQISQKALQSEDEMSSKLINQVGRA